MVFLFLQGLNLSLWLGANRPCSLETISCILSIRCVFCIEYFKDGRMEPQNDLKLLYTLFN